MGWAGRGTPSTSPATPYGAVWVLLVFAWVANYLVRMALPALLGPVMSELGLSYGEAGLLAAAIFYAYMAMQVPAGMLGDRVGRKRVVATGLVLCALASVATGFSGGFVALVLARLATGAAQGCLFSNDRVIIAGSTPPGRMALGQGVSFSGPGLGITLGLVLAGTLGEIMPWRWVFVVFALPPLLAAALVARFVPEPARPATPPSDWPLRRLLGVRDLWILGIGCAMPLYVQFAIATWAPLMFAEIGVREVGRAGRWAGLQGLAAPPGLLAWGWVADRASRRGVARTRVMAAALVVSAATMLGVAGALEARASPTTLSALMLATVFCSWGIWGPSFAVLGQLVPRGVHGTAFGVFNTLAFLGAITGPVVTGALRDATGSFAAAAGVGAGVLLLGALLTTAVGGPVPTAAAR
jgi:MFS family permease